MSASQPTLDIRLTCTPTRDGKHLRFPYRVENNCGISILLADGMPAVDQETRTYVLDETSVVIVQRSEAEAVVARCLPPFPRDRVLLSPPLPLVTRLAPGEALERQLDVRVPLAETSPYLADLTIHEYEVVDIQAMILAIGYWPENTPGVATAPADFAPGRLNLFTREPTTGAKLVWQRFPTRGLQLFKRTDEFPRLF